MRTAAFFAVAAGLSTAWLVASVRPAVADGVARADAERLRAGLASADAATRMRALEEATTRSTTDLAACGDLFGPLKEILRRRPAPERALVARLLLRLPGDDATAAWFALLDPAREDDDRVREAAIDAVRDRATDAAFGRALVDAARDEHASAAGRALAIEALGGIDGPAARLVLWTPRPAAPWVEEACRALGLGRRGGLEVVPPLLGLLAHADVAVRTHAWASLVRVTRQNLPLEPAAWAAWWEASGRRPPDARGGSAAGGGDAAPTPADPYASPARAWIPTYYGIPIRGKTWGVHVVFCLDVSASMSEHGIEPARRHLGEAIRTCTIEDRFDVVAFNEQVMPWAGRPVRAHPVEQAKVLAWIASIVPKSYTNMYDAVEAAFAYAGKGRHPSDTPIRLDAVFLLSDGAPNRGRYHVPDQVLRGIVALADGRVPVHTVGAGEEVLALLRQIAAATGGTFTEAID